MNETKQCSRCGINHPVESYHYSNKAKGIRKSVCKDCSYLYVKENIAKDPIAYHSYQKRYQKENPEVYRGNHYSKKIPPVSGVYLIDCKLTDDSYIGCSSNMRNRRYKHARNVGRAKQHNLSKLIDEYSWEAFTFTILEECDKNDIFERETHYIQKLKPNLNKNKNK
jgi:predicted GIY-YIG superfamily endonuclease